MHHSLVRCRRLSLGHNLPRVSWSSQGPGCSPTLRGGRHPTHIPNVCRASAEMGSSLVPANAGMQWCLAIYTVVYGVVGKVIEFQALVDRVGWERLLDFPCIFEICSIEWNRTKLKKLAMKYTLHHCVRDKVG